MGVRTEITTKLGGVSVIIPTRNRPALLLAALHSVLRQTRPVDQIIVVDDGTDAREWPQAIEELSPLIEVIHRSPSEGVAAARNHGLGRARGNYLLFLDDDDLIDPRFVEQGLAVLGANPQAGGVFFRYRTVVLTVPHDGEIPAEAPALPWRLAIAENPVPRTTLEQNPVTAFLRYLIPIHSGLIHRATVGTARFPESLRQGEDTYFWISLAAAGKRFVLDEHAYAIIRRHAHNTTQSRAAYMCEIQPCYERLLADGLLSATGDSFLAHLKLLCFKILTGGASLRPNLAQAIRSPHRLASELGFWTRNFTTRLLRI
jgi:glycosyltransferase involved in cell wall biosynthesis